MAMLATWLWLLFYWWSLLLIKGLLAVGRIVKGCFFIPLGGERWSWWRRCRRRGPRRCGGAEVGSRTSGQLPVFMIGTWWVIRNLVVMMIKGTENDSSQPAMRVKRRGEKSLAGLTAEPAFKPKLEIYKFLVRNHFCFHFKFILFPIYLRCMTVSPRPMVRGTRLPLMFMLCSSVTEKEQSHLWFREYRWGCLIMTEIE